MTDPSQGIETMVGDATPTPTELGRGELFAGRYRVERCLGRGSMGIVYAAHDRVVDDTIALKLLLALGGEDGYASVRQEVRQEVRLARRVTHRNAARTFDLGHHDGHPFITMELVDGESLRVTLARRGRLAWVEVLELGRQLALGLQAAHEVGVVHRDLKPANIMLDGDGRVVITDFGVAQTTSESAAGPDARMQQMLGTPMYMAPEQVEGAGIGPAADLYALGLVMYEALTGQPPFRGQSRIEIAMARLGQPPPDPRAILDGAELPDELAEWIGSCLLRDPAARPASAEQLAQSFAAMLAAQSADPAPRPRAELGGDALEVVGATSPSDQALAVMPFRYRGPADHAYLAEVLTDELIDLLAMTKGLRVSASGATEKFKEERDARVVGRALGVDAIIDGTVTRATDRVRIVARLIDVDTGFQRSAERFEGELADIFDLQDHMAKRVAESLRVELAVRGDGSRVPADAIELYLRGRKRSREPDVSGKSLDEALARFEDALGRAPSFALALAARADAAVRRWFLPSSAEAEDWQRAAHDAVDAALAGAGHLAEAHLAAARLRVNQGQFSRVAYHLKTALEIAPTCAAAHEYLGMLQCDAGRSQEGVRHIELAHELDPSLYSGAFSVLCYHGLRGAHARWRARLAEMRRSPRFPGFVLNLYEFRLRLWAGEVEAARSLRWPPSDVLGSPEASEAFVSMLRCALDGAYDDEALSRDFRRLIGTRSSPRLRTVWGQYAVELLARRGARALALEQLRRTIDDGALLDTDWLERCPLLDPLRDDPRFASMHQEVLEQADRIWRVDES